MRGRAFSTRAATERHVGIQCDEWGAGVYRPKGTEYKFEGKTLVSSSGAFQRVDCDMILQNP